MPGGRAEDCDFGIEEFLEPERFLEALRNIEILRRNEWTRELGRVIS
jgi:hypothetical protein